MQTNESAVAAAAENPEGQHVTIPLQSDLANLEKFLRKSVPHWGVIYAKFSGNNTVCDLIEHIDSKAYQVVKEGRLSQ